MTENPNILLLVLDSTRYKNTSFSSSRDTTPFLQELTKTKNSYSFPSAVAPSCWSLSSHISMFTGMPVREHSITNPTDEFTEYEKTIFKQLEADGYKTAAFSSNPWVVNSKNGLGDVFSFVYSHNKLYEQGVNPNEYLTRSNIDFLKDSWKSQSFSKSLANGVFHKLSSTFENIDLNQTKSVYLNAFSDWIDSQNSPWAVCMNLMDTHSPYRPMEYNYWGNETLLQIQENSREPWKAYSDESMWWELEAFEHLYDGAIRSGDDAVENIVNHLQQIDEYENTLLIVVGDHGEAFGESSKIRPEIKELRHTKGVTDNLTTVPFIIKQPEGIDIIEKPPKYTSLTEIKKIIENVRSNQKVTFDNPSLYSSLSFAGSIGKKIKQYHTEYELFNQPADVFYYKENGNFYKAVKWGDKTRKYIRKNSEWIEKADTVEKLEDLVSQFSKKQTNSVEIDESIEGKLEDLGYM